MNKEKKSIQEIAEINNLTIIETTSERSGYPSRLQYAIIGFENFEKAQSLADEFGLVFETFEKKDGWQLWFRTGNIAFEEFKNSSEDYGDNYSEFDGGELSPEAFYEDEIKPRLSDFDRLEDLKSFISCQEEIIEKIGDASVNEKVIINEGRYYDTIPLRSMYFSHDTHNYAIGLFDRE